MAETPPLTIRLGAPRAARVDAHSAKTGLKLRAAVLDLVDLGLDAADDEAPEKPRAAPAPKAVLEGAERRVGVDPVRLATPEGRAAVMAAPNKPLKRAIVGGRTAPKLDTSMVQVGPAPRVYGAMAKGPKTPKGRK